jgi:hypothetical protein
LTIEDTGPGFHTDSGQPLAAALDPEQPPLSSPNTTPSQAKAASVLADLSAGRNEGTRSFREEAGEGIGLSIVKRLCEMLDASIEMQSVPGMGTTFRILFPRQYAG